MSTWLKQQHNKIYELNRELEKFQERIAKNGTKRGSFLWIYYSVLAWKKITKKYGIEERYVLQEFLKFKFILAYILTRFKKSIFKFLIE